MGPDAMILVFWMLSFKLAFSLSSFIFIKRFFSSSLLSALRKIAGRNINNLRYADDTMLMSESQEELKNLLLNVKEESEKASLKLNIQKTKIMASSSITSWANSWGNNENSDII